MGAWIETQTPVFEENRAAVAPVWVRGLKRCIGGHSSPVCRRTRMGAWIETAFLERTKTKKWSHPYGCVD